MTEIGDALYVHTTRFCLDGLRFNVVHTGLRLWGICVQCSGYLFVCCVVCALFGEESRAEKRRAEKRSGYGAFHILNMTPLECH